MITLFRKEERSPTLWRLHFASDLADPTFYVWRNGALFGTTAAAFMDVPIALNQIAAVDVFDDSGDMPAVYLPSTVILAWEISGDVAISRVEQYVTDAWVVRAQIPATGSGMGRWESPVLDDGATHQFRVVLVDGTGRGGVARELSGVMCRYPDAPSAAITLAGGEFTIDDE